MVLETLGDWLKAFAMIGAPGIILAFFLAWVTARTSWFLQGSTARDAAEAAQRRLLSGKVLTRTLTFPRFNRALMFFFLGFAVLMMILWAGKLLQIVLF